MSAFLVSDQHISVMVLAAQQASVRVNPVGVTMPLKPVNVHSEVVSYTNIDEIGRELLRENCISLNYRYPDWFDDHGFEDSYKHFKFSVLDREYSPAEILRLISCYEYQSCEHQDFNQSWSLHFCDRLRSEMVIKLDCYQQQKIWDI